MTYWLDRKRRVLARAQQLDAEGMPLDGQEEVPDDHPEVMAILTIHEPPSRNLMAEFDALKADVEKLKPKDASAK